MACPGNAEVGDICWTVNVLEKNVRGFDIPMDDTEGVEMCETREEAMKNCDDLSVGDGEMVSRCILEERVDIDSHEWENESEFAAGEGKGINQGDDGSVLCRSENASFTERIVRRAALGWNGNFESEGDLA